MDRIYGDAYLVLVASVGTGPHFGLFPRSIEPRAIHGEYLHIVRTVETDHSEIALAAEQQPNEQRAVSKFTAYTVSLIKFWTEHRGPKARRPEDCSGVDGGRHVCMGDATGLETGAIGMVWGLAEGYHWTSISEQGVVDYRYSLVALLAVDPRRTKRPLPQQYFYIGVCDEGDDLVTVVP